MSRIVGVVAAGGFARRLGAAAPKSMLHVHGITLLEHCLMSLKGAGIDEVVVYNNRTDWRDEMETVVRRYTGVRLVADQGVASTFLLARDAAGTTRASRLCFVYGHAPRPTEHFDRLLAALFPVAATSVSSSSKARVLRHRTGFVEPPFVLGSEAVHTSTCSSWESFLARHSRQTHIVRVEGPNEANGPAEMAAYSRYVMQFCSTGRSRCAGSV